MLEDIRLGVMERMQRMREKHPKWTDDLCPNIRKKLEICKDQHRLWKVIPSGQCRFEVRNGFEGFKVDEKMMTCSCRAWQLSGIPCDIGCAVIYSLHNNPDNYVSTWYEKSKFVAAYCYYIEGLNGMDQWPVTTHPKPLPPIVRKMPGRPKLKRRRDVSEGGGKKGTLSRVGKTMHCKICSEAGHNRRNCKVKQASGAPTDEAENVERADVEQQTVENADNVEWADVQQTGVEQPTAENDERADVEQRTAETEAIPNEPRQATETNRTLEKLPVVKKRKKSERIKIANFKKPLPPGPGLTDEDRIVIE